METRSVNTPTGPATVQAPKGIDTGWGYNVGEAHVGRGAQRLALERHGGIFDALEAPGGSRPAAPGALDAVAPRRPLGPRARDEAGLRRALRTAIGGDEAVIVDPIGGRVQIGQAVVDHIVAAGRRRDGREAYFPLIREMIEDPAEIWVGFATARETGRVGLRRRYVKLFRLKDDTAVTFVADADGGRWSGFTFFRGDVDGLRSARIGLRLYRKGE
jgi:hypothetical protein